MAALLKSISTSSTFFPSSSSDSLRPCFAGSRDASFLSFNCFGSPSRWLIQFRQQILRGYRLENEREALAFFSSLSLYPHPSRMSNPPLTYDLPDRYLEPITERQLELLEERRAIAVESPLGSTVKLPFTSSNLHPTSTVDVALLNQSDHPSPNPLRPVNESLLHRLQQSPSNLKIKLLKTLQSGIDKWSQVWTATVEGEERVYGKVVVKLLVESLYPFPDGSWVNEEVEIFDWWSAKWFESREARA